MDAGLQPVMNTFEILCKTIDAIRQSNEGQQRYVINTHDNVGKKSAYILF